MSTWLHEPSAEAPCTIVGEVAQAHDGSLGTAHAYIDAIAAAGADAVKFQTHIAAAESTAAEPWRKRFSPQDETRLDYWRRMEFTEPQWEGLRRHAEAKGLLFLSSPFSIEAFRLLRRVGVAGWKIASGEITNDELLDAAAATGQPVILSTGMSGFAEVDAAVERVRRTPAPLAVLQCTTMYPTPAEAVGINALPMFRERYGCAVGLSDHSATIYPAVASAMLGAQMVEVHVALSRDAFGPDVVASVTPAELRQLVDGVRFVERMRASPVDRTEPLAVAAPLRDIFMKSIVAARDLPAGTVLQREDLALKKPGGGLPAAALAEIVGQRLVRPLAHDAQLARADLEGQP
ncbi:MAG: N-acetylneuraminate synthase family protein [Alphaproteobacteria bacterium]